MKNSIKVQSAIHDMTQADLAKKQKLANKKCYGKNKYAPWTVLSLKIAKPFNKSLNDIFFLDDIDQTNTLKTIFVTHHKIMRSLGQDQKVCVCLLGR